MGIESESAHVPGLCFGLFSLSHSRGFWPGFLCWSMWKFFWRWEPASCGVKLVAGWWSDSFRYLSMVFSSCSRTIIFFFKVHSLAFSLTNVSAHIYIQNNLSYRASSMVQIWDPDFTSHNPTRQRRRICLWRSVIFSFSIAVTLFQRTVEHVCSESLMRVFLGHPVNMECIVHIFRG